MLLDSSIFVDSDLPVSARNQESVLGITRRICEEGDESWKLWLFEFVDDLRRRPAEALIVDPPVPETPPRLRALIASTVEALCDELDLPWPRWTRDVPSLPEPWFVSGIENLKATALVESPAWFRKRNIFVLGNFLDRR